MLYEWKEDGPEMTQSGKRMMQALLSLDLAISGIECGKAAMVASQLTRRRRLSRLTPTHFCGLSSDVGNALIAGADEQILRSRPIVQKWFARLGWSFSTRLSLIVTSSTSLSPNCSLIVGPCIVTRLSFSISTFGPSLNHLSFISSKWDARHISHHSTAIHDLKQRALGLVDISSHTFLLTFRPSSLPTQPDEFGVALLSFSDVEQFFDGTRLDWPALILSC
ncbi:hypothetical protein BLNAU_22903 [Blattamonas nauphoetae]|uniref:Uncharacterized protein n=1 Tax=Blattamonas nauphoetae TaxID=2049346 RepID=A0ABQ9WUS6_9EUKA|nr:hypothetical protein BLNAU_22903 [Blattamonas nauphoetae]